MDSTTLLAGAELSSEKENEQQQQQQQQQAQPEVQPAKPGLQAAAAAAAAAPQGAAEAGCSPQQQHADGAANRGTPGRRAQEATGEAAGVIDLVGPAATWQPAAARAATALTAALAPQQRAQQDEVINLLSDSDSEGPRPRAITGRGRAAGCSPSPAAAANGSVIDLLSDDEEKEHASQMQQLVTQQQREQQALPEQQREQEQQAQQQEQQQREQQALPAQQREQEQQAQQQEQQQQPPLADQPAVQQPHHRQVRGPMCGRGAVPRPPVMLQRAVKHEPGVGQLPAAVAAAAAPDMPAAAAPALQQQPGAAAAAAAVKLEEQDTMEHQPVLPAAEPCQAVPPQAATAVKPQGSGCSQPACAPDGQPSSSGGNPGFEGSSQQDGDDGTPSKRAAPEPEAQPPFKFRRVQQEGEAAAAGNPQQQKAEQPPQQPPQAAEEVGTPAAAAPEPSCSGSHASGIGEPAGSSRHASSQPAAADGVQREQQQQQEAAMQQEADADAAVRAAADALLAACEQQAAAEAAAAASGRQAAEQARSQQVATQQADPQRKVTPPSPPFKSLNDLSPGLRRLAESLRRARRASSGPDVSAAAGAAGAAAGSAAGGAPAASVSTAAAGAAAAAAAGGRADGSAASGPPAAAEQPAGPAPQGPPSPAQATSAPAAAAGLSAAAGSSMAPVAVQAGVVAPAGAAAAAAPAVGATGAAVPASPAAGVAAAAAVARAAALPAAGAAAAGEEEPMPDPSDAGAMLRWLRARIPPPLLERYRQPHAVSEAEAAKTAERLQQYEAEVKRVRDGNLANRKHDLVAAKNVEQVYPHWGLWSADPGHKQGIAVGQRFTGRGQLKALGIHSTYFTGIQTGGPNGTALAICLSGGYEDDDDHGDWFWYTGEGGRNDKTNTQVKDQAWVRGNAALCNAQQHGTPVRVVRAAARNGDPKQGFDYTYDGLYCIIRAGMEPSQAGPLVCRFLLVGVPGQYKANKSVSWVELRGFRNNLRLAAQADSSEGGDDDDEEEGEEVEGIARRAKRARTQKAAPPSSAAAAAAAAAPRRPKKKKAAAAPLPRGLRPVVQDGAWLRAQQARPGFLCADISQGAEVRKVPVFNEVDDEPPPQLQYVRESIVGSTAAQALLDQGRSVVPATWCGRELGRKKGNYNEHGLLLYTRCTGVWECGSGCRSTACQINRGVSDYGLRLPLEVFRTRGKGWGLRCAEDIPSGALVCSYEGELISSREAEERRGDDWYLFDLDHFVIMHADPKLSVRSRQALPGLPFEAQEDSDHLVIDAHKIGNLGRFLNHSCSPNLMKQPVLIPGDSGLRYRMCFFAYGDITKGTELVYDYSYERDSVPGVQITCHCGAAACKGRLL